MTQPIPQLWADFTREERFFTAWLYHDLRQASDPFGQQLGLDGQVQDVGYEICFFRDYRHWHGGPQVGSPKQTFDLVLTLSGQRLVLIEAKAQQGYTTGQLLELQEARRSLPSIVDVKAVLLVGLHSSLYKPSPPIRNGFYRMLTWAQIASLYPQNSAIYERADSLYRQRRPND